MTSGGVKSYFGIECIVFFFLFIILYFRMDDNFILAIISRQTRLPFCSWHFQIDYFEFSIEVIAPFKGSPDFSHPFYMPIALINVNALSSLQVVVRSLFKPWILNSLTNSSKLIEKCSPKCCITNFRFWREWGMYWFYNEVGLFFFSRLCKRSWLKSLFESFTSRGVFW